MRTLLHLCLCAAALWIAGGCGAVDNDGGSGGDADSDSDSDTDSDGDADTTIYDLRQGNVAENTVVTLQGVIVTSPVHTTEGAVFVEEPQGGQYSGIHVYLWTEALAEHYGLMPGDVVTIKGEYAEFYGVSEITVQSPLDLEVTGTADVPAPALVDPADVATGGALAEAYESVLVKVQDVTVTDADAGYGEFVLDDSLHVADFFFDGGEGPSGPNVLVADDDTFDSITGISLFAFDEFTLGPRFLEDYQGLDHQETTIYDVQQGLIDENTSVLIESAVVTSPVHETDQLVYVQELEGGPYSGILLYLYSEVIDAVDLQPGDEIAFSGEYLEYFEMSEIEVTSVDDLVMLGSGSAPAPEVVAAADIATGGVDCEAYESVLVQVQDVTVTDDSIGYGSFVVTDDLIVDDFFFTSDDGPSGAMPAVAVDDVFTTLSGPLTYAYDEFRLLPRDATDMVFE
jgi:hypothetical protein